ncbi:hypothetical protein LAUMK4_05531 [Mycobacterium persicum]|uniref:DUF35 domain-containing protein n=1 Tax=Mycobacterium persicum TaxID=1487726 RepID=A0AB38ULA4_9MYCO|nr:hypothetical protein LAUMK15_00261 [Mycobacterium persicum]VAZ81325.1 hypothetical protein LAUMK42_00126 [Mycobacterium persicum]VBA31666.1 hypothetical protein LAUMK4_05531 [Mycobacterium persicum]
MKLCMVCAYPLTPVLNGVCKTCGSMRVVPTSLQITAIQRHTYCVDNNLLGVSVQVTASGVLVFAEIFSELSLGNGDRAKAPSEKFASGNLFGAVQGGPAAGYEQPTTQSGHRWATPGWTAPAGLDGPGVHRGRQRPM